MAFDNMMPRSQTLFGARKTRNPYLNMAGTGFSDLSSLTRGFTQDLLDTEQAGVNEEDRLRKLTDSPSIIGFKKQILRQAGHTPDEIEVLAADPTYWRPEWLKVGIPRPQAYAKFGSTTGGRWNEFTKDTGKKLEKARYLQNANEDLADDKFQRQLDRDIEKQHQLREEFPGEFDGRLARANGAGGAGRRYTASKTGASKEEKKNKEDAEFYAQAVNRESLRSGGGPIVKPGQRVNPIAAKRYLGMNISKEAQSAKDAADLAEMDLNKLQEEGVRLQDWMSRNKPPRPGYSDPNAAERETNANRLLELKLKVPEIKNKLKQHVDTYKGAKARAEDYGFDFNGTQVNDPEGGASYLYRAPMQGPPTPQSVDSAVNIRNQRRYQSLPTDTKQKINRMLDASQGKMIQGQVFDEETDNLDPNGFRARLINSPPTRYTTGHDAAIKREIAANEIDREGERIRFENPDLTPEEARIEAASRRQSGVRRRLYPNVSTTTEQAFQVPSRNSGGVEGEVIPDPNAEETRAGLDSGTLRFNPSTGRYESTSSPRIPAYLLNQDSYDAEFPIDRESQLMAIERDAFNPLTNADREARNQTRARYGIVNANVPNIQTSTPRQYTLTPAEAVPLIMPKQRQLADQLLKAGLRRDAALSGEYEISDLVDIIHKLDTGDVPLSLIGTEAVAIKDQLRQTISDLIQLKKAAPYQSFPMNGYVSPR